MSHSKVGRRDPGEVYNPRIRKLTSRYARNLQRDLYKGQNRDNKLQNIGRKLRKQGVGVEEDFLMTGNPRKPRVIKQQIRKARRTGYY